MDSRRGESSLRGMRVNWEDWLSVGKWDPAKVTGTQRNVIHVGRLLAQLDKHVITVFPSRRDSWEGLWGRQ
jgi:hypothetical protein